MTSIQDLCSGITISLNLLVVSIMFTYDHQICCSCNGFSINVELCGSSSSFDLNSAALSGVAVGWPLYGSLLIYLNLDDLKLTYFISTAPRTPFKFSPCTRYSWWEPRRELKMETDDWVCSMVCRQGMGIHILYVGDKRKQAERTLRISRGTSHPTSESSSKEFKLTCTWPVPYLDRTWTRCGPDLDQM